MGQHLEHTLGIDVGSNTVSIPIGPVSWRKLSGADQQLLCTLVIESIGLSQKDPIPATAISIEMSTSEVNVGMLSGSPDEQLESEDAFERHVETVDELRLQG